MTTKTCETCRFWDPAGPSDDGEHGDCHRHAPRPLLYSQIAEDDYSTHVCWTTTRRDDWCGEWKADK